MASFDYTALDARGRTRSGLITAASERAARAALQERRLAPVQVRPSTRPEATSLFDRFTAKDLTLVTRQLATLISVSPLEEALRTVGAQAEKPAVRRVLTGVHAGVVEGFRLSDAMGRQERAFPPFYRAMTAAGESSGALPVVLEQLADLLERDQQVRGKMLTALVYPAALSATAVVVIIALMTFVVPKVVEQFESMGRALPLLTRIVVGVSAAMANWGWLMLLVLALAVLAFGRALRNAGFRRRVDAAVLRTPFVGRIVRDVHAARLARTLSIMTASGLPLVEGLVLTARTVGNTVLRAATEGMASDIREGASLSASMRRAGVFPPILLHMTASGESSGRLPLLLERAGDYLEREFNTFTSVALSLLEPAIIVVLGAVVAAIVLSILLPILEFNSLVAS